MYFLKRIRSFRRSIAAKATAEDKTIEEQHSVLLLSSEVNPDECCRSCGDLLDVYSTIYRFTTPKKVHVYGEGCGKIRRMLLLRAFSRTIGYDESLARIDDPSFFNQQEGLPHDVRPSACDGAAYRYYVSKPQRLAPLIDIVSYCDICKHRIDFYEGEFSYTTANKKHVYCHKCIGRIIYPVMQRIWRAVRDVENAPHENTRNKLFGEKRDRFYNTLIVGRWDYVEYEVRYKPYGKVSDDD